MDTSLRFIELCRKAQIIVGILKLEPHQAFPCKEGVFVDALGSWYYLFGNGEIVPLFRQDQLQRMLISSGVIAGNWRDVLAKFVDTMWEFEDEDNVGYWANFNSIEQLWLAFVMKERYRKFWNGTDWVETETP